jgi:hypothetical protein
MTRDEAVSDLVQRYLCAVGEELPRKLRTDVTRELRTLVEDKLEERAQVLAKPIDLPLAAYVLQEIGEPGEVARRYDPSPQYLVGPRFYPAFVKIGKIVLAGLAILVLLTTVLGRPFTPEGTRSLLTWGTLGRVLERYFQMVITLFGQAVIVLAILERTKLGQRIAPSGRWDPLDLPETPEAEEDRVTVGGAAVDVCLTVLFAVLLNFFPQWVGVIMVNKAGPTFVRLADLGVYMPLLAINVWLTLALVLKLIVLRQLRWTTPTRWANIGLGFFGAAILLAIAAKSTLQAPASAPLLQPVLWVFGRLIYVVPFAVLIGPVLRIVRLVKGHPAPAPVR